jgi:prepilin-type N-terminal cleavage/methylation domain-containing protein
MKFTGSNRGPGGFTIVELMVVVAIVAVVLVLAAPSFRDMMELRRLRGTGDQLITDLQFARSEAVSRQELVGFSFAADTTTGLTCYTVHTCGNVAAAACRCECASSPNNPCVTSTQMRNIRTVLLPSSGNVRLAPVLIAGASGTPEDHILFDPATGGMPSHFNESVMLGKADETLKFWALAWLISRGNSTGEPTIRTEVSPAGRPSACAPGGRVPGLKTC